MCLKFLFQVLVFLNSAFCYLDGKICLCFNLFRPKIHCFGYSSRIVLVVFFKTAFYLLKRNFFFAPLMSMFVVFDSLAEAFTRISNNETMFFNTCSMENVFFLATIPVGQQPSNGVKTISLTRFYEK